MKNRIGLGLPILFLASLMAGGCGTVGVKSVWMEKAPPFSGDIQGWNGGVTEVNGPKVSLGAANNEDSLFLAMVFRDTDTEENPDSSLPVTSVGLTAWFDPEGGSAKAFGIQFPEVTTEDTTGATAVTAQGPAAPPSPGAPSPAQGTAPQGGFIPEDLEILDGQGGTVTITSQALAQNGFESWAAYLDNYTFVYEIKIPLRGGGQSPFPPELAQKGALSLEMIGEEFQRQKKRSGGGRHHGGGGMGLGGGFGGGGFGLGAHLGGGFSGGGGGGENGASSQATPEPEKFDVWTRIDLAAGKP